MRSLRRLVWLPALCLVCALGRAHAASPAELRAIYDANFVQHMHDYAGKMGPIADDYSRALAQMEQAVQKTGHLQGLLTVQKEQTRFRQARTVTEDALVAEPVELRTAQMAFLERARTAAADRNQAIAALTRMYVARLETLQQDYTRAGNVAEALAIRAEIERARSAQPAEAGAAKAGVADPVVAEQVAIVPARGAPPQQPAGPSNPASAASANPESSSGITVYTGDEKPPQVRGQSYKRLTLSPTELSKQTHPASCRAALCSDRDKASTSGGFYGETRSLHQYDEQHQLRLSLKPRLSADILENQTVVAQFFSREVGRTGRITPRSIAIHHCAVPRLDASEVHIDFPAVGTQKSASTTVSSYFGSSSSKSGEELYGVVITVLDTEGNVTFQAASAPNLSAMGAEALAAAKQALSQGSGDQLRARQDEALRALNEARDRYFANRQSEALRVEFERRQADYMRVQREYFESGAGPVMFPMRRGE